MLPTYSSVDGTSVTPARRRPACAASSRSCRAVRRSSVIRSSTDPALAAHDSPPRAVARARNRRRSPGPRSAGSRTRPRRSRTCRAAARGSPSSTSNGSSSSEIAIASRPPGARWRCRPAEERDPAVAAAEQLDRLHRHDAQRKPPVAEVERAGVRAHGVDLEVTGALGERGQQLGVDVERGHAVAGASERRA